MILNLDPPIIDERIRGRTRHERGLENLAYAEFMGVPLDSFSDDGAALEAFRERELHERAKHGRFAARYNR